MSGGCEVERRWEEGIPHDRRSMALYKSLEQIDLANDDYFCWKAGGDGDNGERLMYLLDIHFAKLNSAPPPGEEREDG